MISFRSLASAACLSALKAAGFNGFAMAHAAPLGGLPAGAALAAKAAAAGANGSAHAASPAVAQVIADALHGGEASGPTLSDLIHNFTNGAGASDGVAKLGALPVGGGLEVASSAFQHFGGGGFGHDFSTMTHETMTAAMVHG